MDKKIEKKIENAKEYGYGLPIIIVMDLTTTKHHV